MRLPSLMIANIPGAHWRKGYWPVGLALALQFILACVGDQPAAPLPAVTLTVPPPTVLFTPTPSSTRTVAPTPTLIALAPSPAVTATPAHPTPTALTSQPTLAPSAQPEPTPTPPHPLEPTLTPESTPTLTPPPSGEPAPFARLEPDPSTISFTVGRPQTFTIRSNQQVKVIGNNDGTIGANIGAGRSACPEETGGRQVRSDGETVTLYPCRPGKAEIILEIDRKWIELARYPVAVYPAYARLEPNPTSVEFTGLQPQTFTLRTNQEVRVVVNPTSLQWANMTHEDRPCPGSLRSGVVRSDGETVTIRPCEPGVAQIWLYHSASPSVLEWYTVTIPEAPSDEGNPDSSPETNAADAAPSPAADQMDRLALETALSDAYFEGPVELLPWLDGGLAVVNRTGLIEAYPPEGRPYPIIDLKQATDLVYFESGLLSAALDPEFENFPYLYVYYWTRGNFATRLSRFPVVDGRAVPEDELIIVEIKQPGPVHNGGSVRFGPDGMLYLGFGDGGGNSEEAQNLASLLGSIIRIDVRGASTEQPYRIPEDNPLVGVANARPEIWAWGLRNPWRMSFDPDGQLWVGDVGTHIHQEEISIVRAGENYGWPVFEGFECVADQGRCRALETVKPLLTYGRSEGSVVVGGIVYDGAAMPWLRGSYIFGDFGSGRIWALTDLGAAGWQKHEVAWLNRRVASFGADSASEIYVLTFQGPILRLTSVE